MGTTVEKVVIQGEDRASPEFKKASSSFEGLAGTVKKAGLALGAFFGAQTLIRAGVEMTKMASDANEAAAAFSTTFGPAVGGVSEFVDEFANKAGFATYELEQMLAVTGNVVQGIGATEEQSAALATQMATLAGDVASFSNAQGGAQAVMAALQSAINGEREALKTYGLAISETEVQQQALNDTGKKSVDELTRLEKATATVEVAYKKAGKAVGDLDRTQDSAANTMRRIQAEFKEMQVRVGGVLLKAFQGLMPVIEDLIPELEGVATNLAGIVAGIAPFVSAILRGLNPALKGLAGYLKIVGMGLTSIMALFGDEASKKVLRMTEAVDSFTAEMEKGGDPTVAFANSLAHLARNGTLSAESVAELQAQTGASNAVVKEAAEMLKDYAVTGQEAAITNYEVAHAFGEATAAEDRYDKMNQGARVSTEELADAAEETGPKFGKLDTFLDEAGQAAKEAGEKFRENLAADITAAALEIGGAVETLDVTFDEFVADLQERMEQISSFQHNIALLYALGFDDLAAQLEEWGVTTAPIAAEAAANITEAASLEAMIENSKADAEATADAIGTAIEGKTPSLAATMQAFGVDLAEAVEAGFSTLDLASTMAQLMDRASQSAGGGGVTTPSGPGRPPAGSGATPFAHGSDGPLPEDVLGFLHAGEEVISAGDRRTMISLLSDIASGIRGPTRGGTTHVEVHMTVPPGVDGRQIAYELERSLGRDALTRIAPERF